MDQTVEKSVRSRFNIDPSQQLEDFHFREATSEVQSSVILLSQRVKRQYMSEFVLPDDTRIAVRRLESSMPTDQTQVVVVDLAVKHPFDTFFPKIIIASRGDTDDYESTSTLEMSGDVTTDSEGAITLEKVMLVFIFYSLLANQFDNFSLMCLINYIKLDSFLLNFKRLLKKQLKCKIIQSKLNVS